MPTATVKEVKVLQDPPTGQFQELSHQVKQLTEAVARLQATPTRGRGPQYQGRYLWHTLTELSVFVCRHALRGPYLSHCIMHSCLVCMYIRLYCHCLTSTINMCVLYKKRQSFYPLRHGGSGVGT